MADKAAVKYPGKLSRPLPYDGEKVWRGDWFAAPLYPGPRCLIVLRPSDSPMPVFLDSHRREIPGSAALRNDIINYLTACREGGIKKDHVIDCRVGVRKDDGYISFDNLGNHLPHSAMFYADDIYSYSVFRAGEGTQTFSERRKRLGKVVRGINDARTVGCHLFITKYTKIESRSQLQTVRTIAASYRPFGVVLRRDAPYEYGKTGDILIWKWENDV